jgi:hypothetical protein
LTDVQIDRPSVTELPRTDLVARFLKPHWLVVAAAWLFIVAHFAATWTTVGNVFNDTDDAMRLVEVRDFLAGQGWFDLHQYRLDPPADLPMHWSRLVDLPIAVLIRLAEFVVPTATAEKLAMYLWPTLVLIPALFAVRRIACRLGGDWAAFPAVYLTATCAPVIGQFVPGRIDHHNVQITLTLWLLATLFETPSRRRGIAAAVISAVMMAVGMETLPFLVFAALAIVQRWVWEEDRAEAIAYGLALAGGAVAAMVATLPPSLWTWGACDALSADYVALAVVGGLGLAGGAIVSPSGRGVRLAFLAAVGGVAIFAFALPEPACLRGPFGQILPEVRAVWLDGVTEIQPWRIFFSAHHVDALVALIVPLVAALAVVFLAGDARVRRSVPFWILAASAALATAIGLMQIRTIIYADVLSVPLIAAAAGRWAAAGEARGRSATVSVLVATVLASSSLATFVIGKAAPATWKAEDTAVTAAGPGGTGDSTAATGAGAGAPCMTLSNYAGLAQLPPGLVAAEINIGPSILAGTPHSVVTAPYHRMQRGILDGDRILRSTPDEALLLIDLRRVDYVALCTASVSAASARETEPKSLLVALMDGHPPDRLKEIGLPGSVVRVFRVEPASAFAHLRGALTFD